MVYPFLRSLYGFLFAPSAPLFFVHRVCICAGRQSVRCRDSPNFYSWQLTSGRQQKNCQQCQPPWKRTGPKSLPNLFPQSFPPNRFHQEATTEVQRRAAEWERQIEHLDAKELLKKSSSSRGFFWRFLVLFDENCLKIFDRGVVSVSWGFCLVLLGLLVHQLCSWWIRFI